MSRLGVVPVEQDKGTGQIGRGAVGAGITHIVCCILLLTLVSFS